ncbi:MAG: tRNA (guanosine(37)-N1)-methyltransferase TrmD [Clostridia bacterium]|nr:tRNA (guanosine(37)-N1)-methyltransferase TrmD [Clostridia bacterium]MBQ3850122.1 tRNA (guanosine(37)-N1)-methyltransferase TrmD [Clostridia bacterium]
MRIDVLTLFPEMFEGVFHTSMLGRAESKGILSFHTHDIREYSQNKHHNTDDYAFGGGAGMVMMAQPIFDCMEAVLNGESARRILMTPRGRTLTPNIARELAKEERIVILAGHYEGLDERISELIDDEISIGDYVLTGGELPAMVLVDCLARFIPGVLGCSESAEDESFSNDGLLEYPQYTRPADFRGRLVPEVLLNGNHAEINKWRRQQSLLKTLKMRPELLEGARLSKSDVEFLEQHGYAKQE